jgi:hypothetical protein
MGKRVWALIASALFFCGLASTAAAQAPSPAERTQAREIYQRIIAFDTSVEGGQNPAMAEYLAGLFRAGGFAADDVHVLPLNTTAGLLVRYRGNGSGGAPILLLAHMDVVPALRSDWERDPFALVEENGFFFGRGTIDNKAGIAHLVSTFLTLRAEGFTPTRDLIIWFSGDEETSGATTEALLANHRALLGGAEFALNSDAGGGQLDANNRGIAYVVQTAEKDLCQLHLHRAQSGWSFLAATRGQRDLRSQRRAGAAARFPVSGDVERHHDRELPQRGERVSRPRRRSASPFRRTARRPGRGARALTQCFALFDDAHHLRRDNAERRSR